MAYQDQSEAEELRRSDLAILTSLHGRWRLWLAIGNGGGLLALGSKIADNLSAPTAYVLFPSCWLFATGLLFAGASVWLAVIRGTMIQGYWHSVKAGAPQMDPMAKPFGILEDLAETTAAILFMAGLTYPLAVVTIRYIAHGAFGGT